MAEALRYSDYEGLSDTLTIVRSEIGLTFDINGVRVRIGDEDVAEIIDILNIWFAPQEEDVEDPKINVNVNHNDFQYDVSKAIKRMIDKYNEAVGR